MLAFAQVSNLKQMNFSDTEEVFSKERVLKTTITAGYHVGNVDNKSITSMVYNNSLGGPTLHVNPGDRIELNLINALNESTNLHFHGLHISPSNNSDNIFIEVVPGETQTYVIDLLSIMPLVHFGIIHICMNFHMNKFQLVCLD
jgi:suppressor of ftsI